MSNVIIIGAGMGGLTAGNLLAQKGHRVTVFESHATCGGYTAGFKRGGYYFESGTLSFEASARVFKAMRDIGVMDRVEFVRQQSRFCSEKFDGMPQTYPELKRLFYAGYPGEKERLDRFFAVVDGMYRGFEPFMTGSNVFGRLAGGLRLLLAFRKYGDVPLGEFAGRYFEKGSPLYNLTCGIGYPDMAALLLPAAYASVLYDYWTVKGGMQSWADALAAAFKARGGELRLNAPVERILTKDGKAIGVVSKGETHPADYVVSAGDYKKTFLELLDDPSLLPADLRARIEHAPVSEGIFVVYLGLTVPNDELLKHLKAPHVGYLDERPSNIYDTNDQDYFRKAGLTIFSPSLVNPAHAPRGTSSLMIETFAPTGWMGNWGGGDKQRYRALKEKAAGDIIEKASRLVPGLPAMIAVQDAATPLTFARYTHNTQGATSAWSWNPRKKFYPSLMSTRVETPVRDLFVGSCWASEMGGIPGAIGAAQRCAKKIH